MPPRPAAFRAFISLTQQNCSRNIVLDIALPIQFPASQDHMPVSLNIRSVPGR
jgi:hypothetical protein